MQLVVVFIVALAVLAMLSQQVAFGQQPTALPGSSTGQQSIYVLPGYFEDTDQDGVPDVVDRCQGSNDYRDEDFDSTPDGCDAFVDPNPDGDGIPNDRDNCKRVANPQQEDRDGDLIGDACDAHPDDGDEDRDGFRDSIDNCVSDRNPSQSDWDEDGIGNVCDPTPDGIRDYDRDGIIDYDDNCWAVYNPTQSDFDADGVGDLCDGNPGLPPVVDYAIGTVLAAIGGGFGMIYFHHHLKNKDKR